MGRSITGGPATCCNSNPSGKVKVWLGNLNCAAGSEKASSKVKTQAGRELCLFISVWVKILARTYPTATRARKQPLAAGIATAEAAGLTTSGLHLNSRPVKVHR